MPGVGGIRSGGLFPFLRRLESGEFEVPPPPARESLPAKLFEPGRTSRLSDELRARKSNVLFDEPPAFAPIDETHPARPESSYSLAKLAGESLFMTTYTCTGRSGAALGSKRRVTFSPTRAASTS